MSKIGTMSNVGTIFKLIFSKDKRLKALNALSKVFMKLL